MFISSRLSEVIVLFHGLTYGQSLGATYFQPQIIVHTKYSKSVPLFGLHLSTRPRYGAEHAKLRADVDGFYLNILTRENDMISK